MEILNLNQEIRMMHAELCSAVSDPNRILILYILSEEPLSVGEIAEKVELSPSATSRHLKILREKAIVSPERDGTRVIYRLVTPQLIDALEIFKEVLNDQIAHRANLLEMDAQNEK
jgi:ArsR family transcriptional regulator